MSMEVGSSSTYLSQPRHSWWSTQTTKEKALIIACAITSILTLIFIICTIALATKESNAISANQTCPVSQEESKDKECNTQECKEIAHQMKMYMDQSVDPCEDFYAFACGGTQYIFEENESTAALAAEKFTQQTLEILSTQDPEKQENKAFKSTLNLYRKCMKQGGDPRGIEAVQVLIKEVLGTDLPMLVGKSWKENEFNMFESVAKIMKLDPVFALQLAVLPDKENYTLLAPWIAQIQKFPDQVPGDMESLICLVYSNCTLDDTFEQELINLTSNVKANSQQTDPDLISMFEKYSLKDMAKAVPAGSEANWKLFFETLFNGTDVKVDDQFRITTMTDFLHIFTDYEKDKRGLANIIGLRIIQVWGQLYSSTISSFLNPALSRPTICLNFVDKTFGFALAKMHTDKYLSQTVIPEVNEMKDEIREGFRQLLLNASWLEKSTQEKALQKLNNMDSVVVFPEWVLNKNALEAHYQDVEPVGTMNFVEGSRLASASYFKKEVNQLTKPLDKKNYWPSLVKDLVNAFYFPLSNSMIYVRGIIMKPFFASNRPRSVKFGTFGQVVGHEITHGFDSKGKAYDLNGHLNNWWDNKTQEKFKNGSDCFVSQYSAVKVDEVDMSINGVKTLAENIADNGGIRAAYQAYKLAASDDLGKIPGFKNYTDDQLFFLTAAQFWCSNHGPDYIATQIKIDTHSPHKYRVLVPYWNFPAFSKAFNCKEGSKMNPKNKCRIW